MATETFTTSELVASVTELDKNLQFEPLILSLFFPDIAEFETEEIVIDELSTDLTLAPFVSPVVQGQVHKHQGQSAKKFTPAYVKPKSAVQPGKLLKRKAGEALNAPLSLVERREMTVMEIIVQQAKQIRRRWEWMAVQAMRAGKVTVAGDNYPTVEVDFQRDPNLTIALAGAARWDQSTATPLQDIDDWGELMEAPISDIVFGRGAWNRFKSFDEVKESINTDLRGSESALEIAPGNGSVVRMVGTLGGNIRCWVYTGYYEQPAGTKQMYVPDNEIILGSAAVEGIRAFGAILDVEALMATQVWPKTWVENDPSVEYVMSQSAPLMVPARPNASAGVTVY